MWKAFVIQGQCCECEEQPLGLSPAILRTCKQIHGEAAPILYSKNTFQFPLLDPCLRWDLVVAKPADELRLRSQCVRLFVHSKKKWHKLFFELQTSLFARFLNSIGKENAAKLETLRFLLDSEIEVDSLEYSVMGPAMNAVMQLLVHHVPGLRNLSINLDGLDEDPEAPFQRVITHPEPELAVYEVLKKTAKKLSGLKYLAFEGFEKNAHVNRELQKLEIGVVREASDDKDGTF